MRFSLANILFLKFMLLAIALCTISACTEDEIPPEEFDQEVLLEITQRSWPAINYDHIFLSTKDGKLVDCRYNFWNSPTEFVNEIPLQDDYLNITFSDFPNLDLNQYRLYTYTNINRKAWEMHKIKTSLEPFAFDTSIPIFWKPEPGINPETYFIYNACNRNNIQRYEWLISDNPYLEGQIYCNDMFILSYEPSGEISYKLFNDINPNDSILLDFDNYTKLPIADLTTSIDGDIRVKNITGLRVPGKLDEAIRYYDPEFDNNFGPGDYGDLADGKIIYPENTFAEFYTNIEITSPKNDYFLRDFGAPIYDYSPTPSKITMDGTDVNSFIVSPNGENADFYGVTWEVKNEDFDIEWTVYHDADQTEKITLPPMPECVIQIQTRLSRSDFKLKSIQSYTYENINSLEDYINKRFDPDSGVDGFELEYLGGRYEKKTVKP